ncbi:type II toxin-antitoxin system YoeB family toxin [Streptomyces sp. NPDC002386]
MRSCCRRQGFRHSGDHLSGYWTRRTDDEHRLVHRGTDNEVVIIKARHRY